VVAQTGFSQAELKNPEFNPQEGLGWVLLEEGVSETMDIESDDISIRSVTFSFEKNISQGVLTVYKMLNIPDKLPELIGTPYEINQFKYSAFTYKDFDKLTIKFRVSKEFLNNLNLTKHDIALYVHKGYGDEEWDRIDYLSLNGEDDNYFHYTSKLIPSNYLLITAMKITNQKLVDSSVVESSVDEVLDVNLESQVNTQNKDPVVTLEVGETVSGDPIFSVEEPIVSSTDSKDLGVDKSELDTPSIISQVKNSAVVEKINQVVDDYNADNEAVLESIEIPKLTEFPAESKSPEEIAEIQNGIYWIIGFFLLAFVILLVLLNHRAFMKLASLFSTNKVDKELHKYVKDSKKMGRTRNEIHNRLHTVGWDAKRIDDILSRHFKK